MDCLPTFSLPAFLVTCAQSLGFYDDSNDSFWGGEEGPGPDQHLGREIPSTTGLHVRSDSGGNIYNPDPIYLIDDPKQTWFEADSCSSRARPALGKLLTDCGMVGLDSLLMTTESLALQSGTQGEFLHPSNGIDTDIIELPSIPPEWKCYSKSHVSHHQSDFSLPMHNNILLAKLDLDLLKEALRFQWLCGMIHSHNTFDTSDTLFLEINDKMMYY